MAGLIKLSNSIINLLKKTPAGRKLAREANQTGNKISGKLHTKIKNFLQRSRDTGPEGAPGVTYGGRTSRSAVISRPRVADYTRKRRIEGAKVGAGAGAGAGAALGYGVGKSRNNKNNNNTAGKKKPSPPIAGHSEIFSKLAGGKSGGKVSRKKGGTVSRKSGGKIMQGYKAGGKV